MIEIHTAGKTCSVKLNLMRSSVMFFINKRCDFLAEHGVDFEGNKPFLWQRVLDCCAWIERIGVVLLKGKFAGKCWNLGRDTYKLTVLNSVDFGCD